MGKHCVYRFFNDEDEIIYIGRTSTSMKQRIVREHFTQGHLPSECYRSVYRIEYMTFSTKVETEIIEKYLINLHKPEFNTRDKEYKDISISIDFEENWKQFSFEKLEDAEKQKLRKTIDELMEEIKKNKNEISNERKLHSELLESKNNRISELECELNLKYKKYTPYKMKQSDYAFRITSHLIKMLYYSDEFNDVLFVGEILVNNDLIEKITIKKESHVTALYFEKDQSVHTEESLTKNFMSHITQNMRLSMINDSGFVPIVEDKRLINRMKQYIENDEYYDLLKREESLSVA
jgi:hypothetical protein